MARWAKSVNAAKNVQQQQLQALIHLEKAEAQAVQSSSFIAAQTTLGAGLQYVAGGGGEVERIAEMRRSGVALSAALEVGSRRVLSTLVRELNFRTHPLVVKQAHTIASFTHPPLYLRFNPIHPLAPV